MTRGKRQTKIIQVKAAPTDNCDVINLVKLANKANKNTCKPDVTSELDELSSEIVKIDTKCVDVSPALATIETAKDFMLAKKQISPNRENMMKGLEDELADNTAAVLEPDIMIVGNRVSELKEDSEKKKKKKKNKKKTKKQKTDADIDATNQDSEVSKRPIKLAPIKANKETSKEESPKTGARVLNNAGCFGFISTWLVKRKERRREKKRKAIEARKTKSGESLVVYDSWVAKGGVAFTVEMDSRPMKMAVLPPIRQRPGPIRMATEQKLESADNKRTSHINKKIQAARAHSRLVKEVADRRTQNERNFKQTTLQKLREKEDKAFRATSRLQYAREQRCRTRLASRMENNPDILASRMENTPEILASRMENTPDMLVSKLESIGSAQSAPRMNAVTPLSHLCTESDISYHVN